MTYQSSLNDPTVSLNKQIMVLAGPAIMEMLMHTLVWTADTAMVGRLTPADIAAVNLGAHMMFTIAAIFGALGTGATAMVARAIGADNSEKATHTASQAMGLSIILGLVIATVGMLMAQPIFEKLVDDPLVIDKGSEYMRIVYIGAYFLIPQMVGNAIIRGSGNTFIPLLSAVVANVFNIVADYALIFGKFGFPAMGSRGAAIATGTAQILGACVTFYYLFRGSGTIRLSFRNLFHFESTSVKNLVKLSIPAGLEVTMNEGSRLVSSFWIAQLGTVSYAAHSLAVAGESVSFMPGYGFAVAAATLMGQRLGAGKLKAADESVRRCALFAVMLMGTVGVLFFIMPHRIMGLLSTSTEAVDLAGKSIRIGAFEQIPIAIAMVISGALKGAGDTQGPFRISLITNLCIRLPLIFLAVFIFRLPLTVVWIISVTQYIVEALLMTRRYRKGHWKTIKV
ncbi:MATE family efflux transporter [Anoxynatronum sibiricum]|uniref:Probable multidrug resistance protein NorM n=1 Tax=Anoxynatronum sibiricum TaxID=210623 RepID=A0ABU9VR79_9CLOT